MKTLLVSILCLLCVIDRVSAGPPCPLGHWNPEDIPVNDGPPVRGPAASAFLQGRVAALGPAGLVPQLGDRRLLIILVTFLDVEQVSNPGEADYIPALSFPVGTTAAYWKDFGFGARPSIRDYFCEVSNDRFHIVPARENSGETDDGIVDWIMDDTPLYQVHPGLRGDGGLDIGAWSNDLAREIIQRVSDAGLVDFSLYDDNGDGYVGYGELLLLLVLAGYDASWIDSQRPAVWPHMSTFTTPAAAPLVNGVRVAYWTGDGDSRSAGYAIVGEWLVSKPDSGPACGQRMQIGQACHELGHQLFLPEGYDTGFDSYGAGRFCLMGYGPWNHVNLWGDSPAHPSAWIKYRLGWLDCLAPNGPMLCNVAASGIGQTGVFIKTEPMEDTEYFLVENRLQTGYDAGLPGSGILIWHIDESRVNNDDQTRMLYDLEEASPYQELETQPSPQKSAGNAEDFFNAGNVDRWTESTTPDTSTNNGFSTGVAITQVSASGPVMSLYLSLTSPGAGNSGGGGGCDTAPGRTSTSWTITWLTVLAWMILLLARPFRKKGRSQTLRP